MAKDMTYTMNTVLHPNALDKIICVKVGKIKRESLYEMTRKYWAVNINRASKATHVLSIVNEIVEEIMGGMDVHQESSIYRSMRVCWSRRCFF